MLYESMRWICLCFPVMCGHVLRYFVSIVCDESKWNIQSLYHCARICIEDMGSISVQDT